MKTGQAKLGASLFQLVATLSNIEDCQFKRSIDSASYQFLLSNLQARFLFH